MRENCTSGSARGVPGNWHSYRRGPAGGRQTHKTGRHNHHPTWRNGRLPGEAGRGMLTRSCCASARRVYEDAQEGVTMDQGTYDRGMAMRRQVLGDAYVDAALANVDA